ncbi:MAG TPA: hypothetical protein VNN17_07135 [Terriglobia bacterium]|nr:hypothetical protein [Terriglobia bacterium]
MQFSEPQKTLLEELFLAGAVLVGESVRARTGLNSPIYFDLREPLQTRPDLLGTVAREFALEICGLVGEDGPPQCVVGVPDTATPLAMATALYAAQNGLRPEIASGLLRKEARDYRRLPLARQMRWVGPKDEGREYNLIDDVVASGITKRAAAAAMRQEGIRLRRIVVLFDRQQGDGLREEGFDLHGIFTAMAAADFYLESGLIHPADHARIKQFLSSRRFDIAPVTLAQ